MYPNITAVTLPQHGYESSKTTVDPEVSKINSEKTKTQYENPC